MTWQARVLSFLVRHRVKPQLGDLSDLKRVRKAFNSPLPSPRGVRCSRRVASSLSSRVICWLSADCTTSRSSAARLMEPCSTTRTK